MNSDLFQYGLDNKKIFREYQKEESSGIISSNVNHEIMLTCRGDYVQIMYLNSGIYFIFNTVIFYDYLNTENKIKISISYVC